MDRDKIDKLMDIIKNSKYLVFFGGAGVSVASGIPDFRGENGLYKESPEEIISHDYFYNHTKSFYDFYFSKMVYKNALPNECHKALAYLENKNILKSVITQNIDSLHQMAGSKKVIELHGSIYRNYCVKCKTFYNLEDFSNNDYICKKCNGIIKPDVVLYGESLDNDVIVNAINEISKADTLIVAGTSLVVYPAASLIRYFRGKNLIVINLSSINCDYLSTLSINGKVEDYLNTKLLKEYNI